MTQQIIYHDFKATSATPTVALTAPILRKGRRLAKACTCFNNAMGTACIFLCGACSAVSLVILFLLTRGS
jgi:hypothetical protein